MENCAIGWCLAFWFCWNCLCEFSILCSFFLWIYVLSCPLLTAATKARLKERWLYFFLAAKFTCWLVNWGLEYSLYLLYIDTYWKQLNEREKICLSGQVGFVLFICLVMVSTGRVTPASELINLLWKKEAISGTGWVGTEFLVSSCQANESCELKLHLLSF